MPALSLTIRVRQISRALLAVLWTAVCYLAWLPGALLTLPFRRPLRRWKAVGIRMWTRGLLVILGIRVRELGTPPALPAFFVANHLSWVDILVLGARLGPTFVAKQEIAAWPVLGHLATATGAIFVDRGRRRDVLRVLREIDRAVDEGATIVLFPEGTSSRGDQVYPLRPALLEWAAQRSHPVQIVALSYGTSSPGWSAEETVCWWGDRPFGEHFRGVLSIPSVEAILAFSDTPVVSADRQVLRARLHEQLARGLHTAKLALPDALAPAPQG
ncbi:MAG TPA: lysophospholipid acyltransferase family protein [Gemmatimonadales bacterium]|nr:lysophospholipid acyltransferase family protein [Gemmatimonadales bacterium]